MDAKMEVALKIEKCIKTLNGLLGEAANAGLLVELNEIDVTWHYSHVRRFMLAPIFSYGTISGRDFE